MIPFKPCSCCPAIANKFAPAPGIHYLFTHRYLQNNVQPVIHPMPSNVSLIKKQLLFVLFSLGGLTAHAQNAAAGIPDSVQNVSRFGSTGSYSISNPLNHNGSQFTNGPTTLNCITNCIADHLYFYDLGLNVPSNAVITGVEVIHQRGACNSGSYMIDSLYLAFNGMMIGAPKRDSSSTSATDTLGSASDLWSAMLAPAIVNDQSFGLFITSTGTGTCTYTQFDIRLKVYYCVQLAASGIPDSVQNVAHPNSTGSYSISNPLNHNGSQFTNPPTTTNCITSCKSDYLYFYDLALNVPSTATITGVEVIHQRGGCNSGSYVIDTLHLAHNAMIISAAKRDSASSFTSDTLGSANDLWSAALTPAIVNSNSFGVFINTTGTGICTFGQFDVRVKVIYCDSTVTGIASTVEGPGINIHPNPVTDRMVLTIQHFTAGTAYSIYDITGRQVASGRVESESTQLETSFLKTGIYVIRISGQSVTTIKFIKQ
jgi:hypothetical protein